MSTLQTLTVLPNASTLGAGATFPGGGSTAHGVLSDGSDTTYLRLAGRLRNANQVTQVGFPVPSIPAGATVVSVALVMRKRQVSSALATQRPRCNHWFRCQSQPATGIGGAAQTSATIPLRDFIQTDCPVSTTTTTAWQDLTEYSSTLGPDGLAWSIVSGGNLNPFVVELGRDDIFTSTYDIAAMSLVITYQQASTVSLTGPTGTVTTTSRPTAGWGFISSDGQPQSAFEVAIYSDAQHAAVGFTPFVTTPTLGSGKVLGEDQAWILTDDLVNGVWWAYIRVWAKFDGQGDDLVTNTASGSWTQSLTGAPAATLQSAVYDPVNDRIPLTFLPSSSSPVTFAFAVSVSRDGAPPVPVRGGRLLLANGMTPITIYDHEQVSNKPNVYRVLAFLKSGSALIPAAAYSNTISVTPATDKWWVLDPLAPDMKTCLPVKAEEGDEVTEKVNAAIFYPVGGTTADGPVEPIIIQGVSYTDAGTLKLFWSDDRPECDWEVFRKLRASRRILLLKKPVGSNRNLYTGFGVGPDSSDPKYKYMATRLEQGVDEPDFRDQTVTYASTSMPPITA